MTAEAFAVLAYANNRDKWLAIWKFKAANGKKAKIPNSPEYDTKYTNTKTGQKKYSGWTDDGLVLYDLILDKVKTDREADAANDYARYKIALDLVRAHNGIEVNSPQAKKRRRCSIAADEDAQPLKIRAVAEYDE